MCEYGRHEFVRYTLDMMETGQKLKRERMRRDISVCELARYLGISAQAIYGWEAGKIVISIRHLMALCGLYKMPMDDLARPKAEKGVYFDYDE